MIDNATLKAAIVRPVRRREPLVLWPSDDVGVGNLLYVWLQVASRRAGGASVVARATPAGETWRDWFPRVFSELVMPAADVGFLNRREAGHAYQNFGGHFSASELERFVDDYLLADSPFAGLIDDVRDAADLTINVRRGDFYSVPRYRGLYSFDVVEFVRTALSAAGGAERILIVSDDLDWCRVKLAWIGESTQVRYADAGASVPAQLAMLAASRRLILANSTFSYWGAHLSNRVHGDNHSEVFAPWFHSRGWNHGAAEQLDPRWSVIREIPGGWDG